MEDLNKPYTLCKTNIVIAGTVFNISSSYYQGNLIMSHAFFVKFPSQTRNSI